MESDSYFIIVCSYCTKVFGEFVNGEKRYFLPTINNLPNIPESHGICPECLEKELKKIESFEN
jgi:hypothetical protein